jgi:hypothetical protein
LIDWDGIIADEFVHKPVLQFQGWSFSCRSSAKGQIAVPSGKGFDALGPAHGGKIEAVRLMQRIKTGSASIKFGKPIHGKPREERTIAIRIVDSTPVDAWCNVLRMSEWPRPEKWKDQTPWDEGFGRVSEISRCSSSLLIAWRQDRRDQEVLLSLNLPHG